MVSSNTQVGIPRLSEKTPKDGSVSQLSEKSVQGWIVQKALQDGTGTVL